MRDMNIGDYVLFCDSYRTIIGKMNGLLSGSQCYIEVLYGYQIQDGNIAEYQEELLELRSEYLELLKNHNNEFSHLYVHDRPAFEFNLSKFMRYGIFRSKENHRVLASEIVDIDSCFKIGSLGEDFSFRMIWSSTLDADTKVSLMFSQGEVFGCAEHDAAIIQASGEKIYYDLDLLVDIEGFISPNTDSRDATLNAVSYLTSSNIFVVSQFTGDVLESSDPVVIEGEEYFLV
jgi:hypothetical protein